MTLPTLAIDADDYGYAPAYDAGIAAAARAGAIDGASLMVLRVPDPAPLLETAVALGLHLEPGPPPSEQVMRFERLVGRPPEYIDGHHHCHAELAVAPGVIEIALRLEIPVRSVDQWHRRALREAGVLTADRLLGRLRETEPALPAELGRWLEGGEALPGVSEWFVHPGESDPATGSSYDAGRAEDLELLLALGDRERWAERGIRRSPLGRALSS